MLNFFLKAENLYKNQQFYATFLLTKRKKNGLYFRQCKTNLQNFTRKTK
jgi:hypothetical protein